MAARAPNGDLVSGGIFVAIGAYFALESLNYEIGTPLRMGPGFMPLALGTVLVALGLGIAATGVRRVDGLERQPVPWRAIALIVIGIALFAFGIRGLGLGPTVFALALLATFASRKTTIVGGLATAAGLTALSSLVFVVGLRLQVPMIGPWLGF